MPAASDRRPAGLVYAAGGPVFETVPGDPRSTRILEICKRPDLAPQVTLQPVEILDVDAAIIFADILLPVEPMGLKLRVRAGEGPHDRQSGPDFERRRFAFDLEHRRSGLCRRVDSARGARRLAGKVPVIGFVGAPFTLASYMIEGGPSKNFLEHEAADVHATRRCGAG